MTKKQESVSRVVLEFDGEIAGFHRLRALVAERYFHAKPETPGQRIVFPAGMEPVVIRHEHYKQAGVGISWSRLPDFVLVSGCVIGHTDSEIVIGLTPPESAVVYRPAPNGREGAEGAAPPAWSSSTSLRNTRPTP